MPHLIARTGRILVIDAQPAHARQLVALLGRHEHTIALAASAEEALGIVSLQPPDLVLLDTMLPQTDGFELLTALRRQPGMKSVPAILLVDKQDHDRRLDAFDAGAVDFVAKPYLADELLARVHVHLRLKLTRDRLERVAQERQQLVNLVAHDLKNPLASVLFACEMLGLPDCRPERTRRYLQIIDESTREALGYIRSYLETQTGPAQAGAAAEVPCVHLGDTLHWLAERYELQLEANGLRLRVDAPQPDVCVAIGEQVLRQVGENLISNALKYARGGGELELVARPGAPGFWQLLVQDRGPGIPASFQPRLFTPFQRLHEHDAMAAVSSGLGLALARQNVADAGGRLWYEDREGGGARFLVELPEVRCEERCA